MLEQILSNPLAAIALAIAVVYMAAIYFTQKERAKVRRMKGRRGFAPQWSSGRRHRARRRAGSGGGFKPQWNRDRVHPGKVELPEARPVADAGQGEGVGDQRPSGHRPAGSSGAGV